MCASSLPPCHFLQQRLPVTTRKWHIHISRIWHDSLTEESQQASHLCLQTTGVFTFQHKVLAVSQYTDPGSLMMSSVCDNIKTVRLTKTFFTCGQRRSQLFQEDAVTVRHEIKTLNIILIRFCLISKSLIIPDFILKCRDVLLMKETIFSPTLFQQNLQQKAENGTM